MDLNVYSRIFKSLWNCTNILVITRDTKFGSSRKLMEEQLSEIEKKAFTMIKKGKDETVAMDGSSMGARERRIKAINVAQMEICRAGDAVDVGLE